MIVKDVTMMEELMSISSETTCTSPAPSSVGHVEKVLEEAAKLSEKKSKTVKGRFLICYLLSSI